MVDCCLWTCAQSTSAIQAGDKQVSLEFIVKPHGSCPYCWRLVVPLLLLPLLLLPCHGSAPFTVALFAAALVMPLLLLPLLLLPWQCAYCCCLCCCCPNTAPITAAIACRGWSGISYSNVLYQHSGEYHCQLLSTHDLQDCPAPEGGYAQVVSAHLPAGVGLGLALALGTSNTLETLTVNYYFHMLFRVALHLKVSALKRLSEHMSVLQPALEASPLRHTLSQ